MANDNSVTLVGNATRDPELRYTSGGTAIASFGLAHNRRWKKEGSSEWEEDVSFFDVKCWSQLGENVAESIKRGDRVVVFGWLDQQSWEDKDGGKRSKVEVVADDVAISIKWATVPDIVKNERPQDRTSGSGGRSSGGRSSGRSSGGSRGEGGGGRRAAPESFAEDFGEEPF